MTRKSLYVVLAAIAFTAAGSPVRSSPRQTASAPSISLPVLSFVVDGDQRLRPVVGIAGAASVSAPLEIGFPVDRAAAPAGNSYVFVTRPDGASPALMQLRGGEFLVRSLDVDPAGMDGIAISPSGSAIAFWSESQQRVYVWTNLLQSPALTATFDLRQMGAVKAFAISDDGRNVATGTAGGLFFLRKNASPQWLGPMQHISAISFLYGDDRVVAADDSENRIYGISGSHIFPLAGPENGIAQPAGVAASADNRWLFVGNAGSGAVTLIGPDGSIQTSPSCNCTLTGLHSTSADSVFRLTDFSGGPIVMFDAASAAPRLFFVPVREDRR